MQIAFTALISYLILGKAQRIKQKCLFIIPLFDVRLVYEPLR